MMKLLGTISEEVKGSFSMLNETDWKYINEITKLNAKKDIHSAVYAQSIEYDDCAPQALTGTYNADLGNRTYQSVHPVIAALFLPKIDCLDSHFIRANLSSIVKSRFSNEEIPMTVADRYFFMSLVEDPNDVVCDGKSVALDLLNRVHIQHNLWNNVLNLRNGTYYGQGLDNLMLHIDSCKISQHDTPEFIYGKYDGTILKRLFTALSFYPTVVSTSPIYNPVTINPYQQHIIPMVTKIPMINIKIPHTDVDIDIKDAIDSKQYLIENNTFIEKNTSIIYSKGVIFFFIDRRSDILNFDDKMYGISNYPVSISGFERLNDKKISFPLDMDIKGDRYRLRSVVISQTNNNNISKDKREHNLILGSAAMIVKYPGSTDSNLIPEFLMYDPLNSSRYDPVTHIKQNPIYLLEHTLDTPTSLSFMTLASNRGIIFMYEVVKDDKSFVSY